jgi:magnesium transporter
LKPTSEKIYHLYVVDKKMHLLGVLSIRSLLTAGPKEKILKFIKTKIAKVKLNTPKRDVAHALTKYNLFALPVVDKDNVLKGVVKADEVLEEIMPKSWKKGTYHK